MSDDNNELLTWLGVGAVAYLLLDNSVKQAEEKRDKRLEETARWRGISKDKLIREIEDQQAMERLHKRMADFQRTLQAIFKVTPIRADIYGRYIRHDMWQEKLNERQAVKKWIMILRPRRDRRSNLVHRWKVAQRARGLQKTLANLKTKTAS